MNNSQFRKLLLDTPLRQEDGGDAKRPPAASASLGAKKSSFVPMTPRMIVGGGNVDFARQVRERHAALQPSKKFKSSAPKGSRFGSGYVDRAKARLEDEDDKDDKTERIRALEMQVRVGQLDETTFNTLRDQIAGGDISSTHLVKGLDRKLLERVRRGEDVLGAASNKNADDPSPDVDDELDELEGQDVQAVQRDKVEKKGSMAPPSVAGVKRTRDEIMAELKAQRKAAAEAKAAAAPKFDDRWRKVGQKEKPKIEIDSKGREVLIMIGEDGKVKKKIRKPATGSTTAPAPKWDMPDFSKPVLGADVAVPDLPNPAKTDDEEDDDIFAGAGTEYDPLGDGDDDDDNDSNDDDDGNDSGRPSPSERNKSDPRNDADSTDLQASTASQAQADEAGGDKNTASADVAKLAPRNYFTNTVSPPEEAKEEQSRFKGIENVLKKAARLGANVQEDDGAVEGESKSEREARLAKRAKMLSQQDRDMDDMDIGFGSSRYGDEDEGGEGSKIRLSQWKGNTAGDDEGWEADEKGNKKKRKPKKRKGDVNNAADIMRVIESRKAGGK